MSKLDKAPGSPKGHRKLAFKHRIALNAFLSGMTQKDAMVEADFSTKTPPSQVFGRDDVKHEIARRREEVAEKYDISQEWLVERLAKIADSNLALARYKKVDFEGRLYWDFTGATQEELALIDELTVSIKMGVHTMKIGTPSRQAAIDSLARILGFNKDKLKLSGEVSLVERLQRGRDRVRDEEK